MPSRIGNHVRSNVVGYLALVIALSGTAYAANKVGSSDIKTGAVKSKQIGDDKVKSKDIKDEGGVKSQDVKDGSLLGEDIDEDSLGTVPRAATADAAASLDGFDPSTLLEGDGVYDATTGSIDVDTGFGAVADPVVTIGPLEVLGVCNRVNDQVRGQVGNLGPDLMQIWVQDPGIGTTPEFAELTQFNGLDTDLDNTPRIATWIGSTGGREFSVDLAMRIVQNGDGTAACDFEARTFLGS